MTEKTYCYTRDCARREGCGKWLSEAKRLELRKKPGNLYPNLIEIAACEWYSPEDPRRAEVGH